MFKPSEDIYSILSKKYGISKQVIVVMCNHPFVFASRRMSDPDDEKSLMFHYLFKIKLKRHLLGRKRILYDGRKRKDKDGNNIECDKGV